MEISQATHGVENQAPPLVPYNVFEADHALREAVEREGGGWGVDRLRDTGELAGTTDALAHSERAERNEPILRTHDRYGNRVDEVELDPSWHWCLRQAIEREIHSLPWRDPQPGAHAVRAALFFVWSQVNSGVMCPVSMTYSAIPALREEPELAAEWEPRITKPSYDDGALVGMAMTEKQGGSDVRANTTRADSERRRRCEITGHKWFCSYPPVRPVPHARAGAGGPVVLPDRGTRPGLPDPAPEGQARHALAAVERGGVPRACAAASSARRAAGCATIIRMVNHTRLDCLIGSSAGMRLGARAGGAPRASPERVRQAARRPAADAERARRPRARVGGRDGGDACAWRAPTTRTTPPFRRIATAVMKYWVCKRAPGHANEALECLGGNGYVEESGMPRLLRDSPLNSIWEGSGNVSALDVLRALAKEPEALPAFLAECELARGGNAALDAHLDRAQGARCRRTRSSRPAAWSRISRSRSRRACSCATGPPRWPMRSAPRGSTAARAAPTGCCRRRVDAEAIVDRALAA